MAAEIEPFGRLPDGRPVELHRIGHVLEAAISPFGATLVSLRVPGRDGAPGDVVLGFDRLAPYLGPCNYLGAVVGRFANRIAFSRAPIGGRDVRLSANEGPHHLHGGAAGFDKALWRVLGATKGSLRLAHRSPDGDEGYPGLVDATVTYAVTGPTELTIDFRATTDAPTIVNLAHHAAFHLGDGGASDALDHVLEIAARAYTPVDASLIPTGAIAPVEGTPLDFTRPRRVGDRVASFPNGYDHNFVLDAGASREPRFAARLVHEGSGRTLELSTTQPGLQFWSGGHLDGTLTGHGGARYGRFHGIALEAQRFPDSPHHRNFPRATLAPGELYSETTVLRFGVA